MAENEGTEGSSALLRSLLGVSPITSADIVRNLGDTGDRQDWNLGDCLVRKEGLTLQEVIERVQRPGRAALVENEGSRKIEKFSETSRLHTLSDLVTDSRREGTPESDSGYGTSNISSSPDNSLSQLIRSMTLKSGSKHREDQTRWARPKLSSISEQDPAVTQAVKSVSVSSHYYDTDHQSLYQVTKGPNLLHTLFGLPPSYSSSSLITNSNDPYWLERAAMKYRTAASTHKATCTWSGQLPAPGRSTSEPRVYSGKVFLGGVPWDITENGLIQAFRQFGPIRIEWPGKGRQCEGGSMPKGFLYVIMEAENAVAALLSQCTQDYSSGAYYYKVSSRRCHYKEVQVIPWLLGDSNFVRCSSERLDPNKTVFVGALHGMLNAEGLAHIFSDLFEGVVYAGIDTDRHKYPIGSGRVTFSNTKSYMKAVAAAFIEIKTNRFTKKIQVDPYLEDALCSVCHLTQGPYFCRDLTCFSYYCRYCWDLHHSVGMQHHKPLMRNTRSSGSSNDRPVEPLRACLAGPMEPLRGLAGQTGYISY